MINLVQKQHYVVVHGEEEIVMMLQQVAIRVLVLFKVTLLLIIIAMVYLGWIQRQEEHLKMNFVMIHNVWE
jgi:hypothetical protein